RLELFFALDGSGEVEANVPGDELARPLQCAKVANRHHVIEAVDADAPPAEPVGEPVARPLGEDLVLDQGGAVLAYIAGFAREDDGGLALALQQDVRVAVDDQEPRQVRDRAFEPGVLAAADERGVAPVGSARPPHVRTPALPLSSRPFHDSSTPSTRASIAQFSGVPMPRCPPKRTIPPFK